MAIPKPTCTKLEQEIVKYSSIIKELLITKGH